jgi:NADH:ubiquinone reductase (H+-translocating)
MESSAPNNSDSSGIDRTQVMPRNTAMLSARHQLLISEDITGAETNMKREISVNSPWRVIIVGGGFGGLRAAQALKSDLFDVTLIDRRNYHLYQPLLGQVAAGSLSPAQISAPLRSVLSKQKNTRVLLGSVEDIDANSKQVVLADGAVLPYDSLIVATGSQTSYFGNDEWQVWAPGLKNVEEATLVRHKILYAFEVAERIMDPVERREWLTFAIVGAGPTGVELAGAIADISRQTLNNDFRSIRPEDSQVILLDGAPRVLMSFPEDLAEKATRSLVKLGVSVKCGVTVKNINKEGLTIESGPNLNHIAAKTVIWAGGIKASSLGQILARRTNAETDKAGRVKVEPDLTIPKYPDIYVVGDLACSVDAQGKPLPGVTQVAVQGGKYAAKAILCKVKRQPELAPFQYSDKGSIAVIGRWAAVAKASGVHLSGLLARIVWACMHVMNLVTFRNRLLVFIQWAFEDLTFSRGARLVTGTAPTDFKFNKEIAVNRSGPEVHAGTVAVLD